MKGVHTKESSEIVVKSPANIAFIKYWGQKNERDILPFNDSFSMNLSNCYSLVKMELGGNSSKKELYIKEYKAKDFMPTKGTALDKVLVFYSRAKKYLGVTTDIGFRIYSENSFPKKAGIASSASFFSALALLFVTAFQKKLSEKELSILARLSGSGSASRSIPDGFSWWKKGTSSDSSYAVSVGAPAYWQLVDLVLITNFAEKKTSSGEGHRGAMTSSYFPARLMDVNKRLRKIKQAFHKKDFSTFGTLIEEEAISMHAVMMTQTPPLYFWSGATVELIKKTVALRESGLEAYFTIDAGENLHIICQKKDEKKVYNYFKKQPEVKEIISNDPAVGARML